MKLAVAYFLVSGALLTWRAGVMITSIGHIGQPIAGIFNDAILEASFANNAAQKQQLEDGRRQFQAQIRRVTNQAGEGGLLLGGVGAIHLYLGAVLWKRGRGRVNESAT